MLFRSNLLPPQKKQEVRLLEFYLMVKNLIITILLLITVTAITLLLTKVALQNHFNQIVDQTTLTTKTGQLFNQGIKDFNQLIASVEGIQREYVSWVDFMAALATITPDGVAVTNIYLTHSATEDRMVITGLAQKRDDLLVFKANLEQSDLFSEIVMPLENLLTREKIKFDIKARINFDTLRPTDENER